MDKIQNVSTLSITFMAISAFLSIVVPIGIIAWMGVKKMLNAKALFFGVLLFIIFSLVLENLVHMLILGKDQTQSPIYKNVVLYILYGGFMAGFFEETARLLGFKFLIKVREGESLNTGISYGLGHGGIESVLVGGFISISYLLTSIMVNGGMLKGTTAAMNEQQLASFNQGISVLTSSPSNVFLIVGIERLVALTLQIALSLLVFKAVRDKKWLYFIYAILIHASVDMVAVLAQRGYISNMFVLEGIILIMTIASIVFALKVSKKVEAE